jgi:hypothetical protein
METAAIWHLDHIIRFGNTKVHPMLSVVAVGLVLTNTHTALSAADYRLVLYPLSSASAHVNCLHTCRFTACQR